MLKLVGVGEMEPFSSSADACNAAKHTVMPPATCIDALHTPPLPPASPHTAQPGGLGQQQAGQGGAAGEVQRRELRERGSRRLQPCTRVHRGGTMIRQARQPAAAARCQGKQGMPGSARAEAACPRQRIHRAGTAQARRSAARLHAAPHPPSASSCLQPNRLSSRSAGQSSSPAARDREEQLTARSSRRRLRAGGVKMWAGRPS